jgi:VanZ family protein
MAAILFKLPVFFIIILIWILSSQSTLPITQGFIGMDKLLHFTAYAAVAAAGGLWFSIESWIKHPLRNFLICVAIACIYGAVDEYHQSFVPGRDSDIWDWVADTLGGMTGAAAIMLFMRLFKPAKRDTD